MKPLHSVMGLLAAVICMSLQAQVPSARAEVPFDFWLGQKLMPAGDYVIYHMATGTLLFEDLHDRNSSAVLMAQPISRLDNGTGRLEFTRYGDTYFLSKIWSPCQTDGYSVPKSGREKELASHSTRSSTTGIAVLSK